MTTNPLENKWQGQYKAHRVIVNGNLDTFHEVAIHIADGEKLFSLSVAPDLGKEMEIALCEHLVELHNKSL